MKTPSRAHIGRQPEESDGKESRVPVTAYLTNSQYAYVRQMMDELKTTTSGVLAGLVEGAIVEAEAAGGGGRRRAAAEPSELVA